jgi:mono/diheme cytochrome c family protein
VFMRSRQLILALVGSLLAALLLACNGPGDPTSPGATDQIERGRYMVIVGGCNDCHTAGYAPSEGAVPEDQWLMGDTLGFRGPWGTTYASNLRLYLQNLTEDQWVTDAQTMTRLPPMPWFGLNEFSEEDLRAMYQFITSLEPVGEPAPAYLPPDHEPPPPYVQWPSGP